ncbi:MAG TPA: hypothetical protein P5136_00895 [Methanofastidiosum sp.]|nr:hypothetical protein [Methanofastidiosum sp.]
MNLKSVVITLAAVIVCAAISFGIYYLGKKINYAVSYESMVKDTIKEMVKPECLKK